jgi:hypothetical protein
MEVRVSRYVLELGLSDGAVISRHRTRFRYTQANAYHNVIPIHSILLEESLCLFNLRICWELHPLHF